ncbi:MAG: glycosyltransferase family 9 protein [Planctomycetes bacterium]|nr:glycosyltransferase family 9 protein [Planctomycetota bacterium]
MDVLVDYQGNWGLGDLLCSDPLILGLQERHGPDTRVFVRGKCGNVLHNPLVQGLARTGQRFDRIVEVKLFTHMAGADYARLEALPSLIGHMCSYGEVAPGDRRPRLHLQPDDLAILRTLALPARRPRIAICADFVDPLRHWPVERWHQVATVLHQAGATVIGIGTTERLPHGLDLIGKLSIRQTAAVLTACDLFVGNNSGPFHYAQAAGLPCVALFSLATPSRFVHPGAVVHPVQADGLPCLHCMTRCFAAMQRTGCIATPRGRCMLDIPVERVLEAIDLALTALPASMARG